jgi:excisionase family DNA binding protein
MENLVVSTIPIAELVNRITAEVVNQIIQYIEKPVVTQESKRLYGDKEAAAYLGCSVMSVQKLRKTGQISFYRYGRKCYYLNNELDEALKVPRRFSQARGKQGT